ncbi:transcriptional activator xlnR [Aaosphaeria arxii CBS 175.79]|uniref:Transcriptional activator xlnR n=1 Tax=Aaosphaeria arxii CBS 175.79 TaxID=1450172 RepID=A0A6A5Y3H2_9PLEO|nr:transcriptional activator xlnR [Aaosphaeria arxii CBS 175.79]KAF2020018.1 transcriptional activator xlnR [Aaosphaeria arxii CBS 175.79]
MLSYQYNMPPGNMVDQHQHLAAQHMHSPLDTLAHTSQYAALQFHQNRHVLPNGKAMVKPHRMPYPTGPIAPRDQRSAMLHERSGRNPSASGPVRRRISRACDQCNQLRTKCDGKAPCAHCLEFGLTCEYVRERKKRGKQSKKEIAAAQAAAASAAGGSNSGNSNAAPSGDSTTGSPQSHSTGFNETQKRTDVSANGVEHTEQRPLPELPPSRSASMASASMEGAPMYQNVAPMSRAMSLNNIDAIPENSVHQMSVPNDGMGPMQPPRIQTQGLPMHNPMQEYASIDDFHRNMMHQSPHPMIQNGMHPIIPSNGMPEYTDSPYSMMSPQSAQAPPNAFRIPTEESQMPGFIGHSPVSGSPGWLSIPSPTTANMYPQAMNAQQQLRYPVLTPLLPHLTNIMPIQLACELLELYFQSQSSAFMQPVSPYVLGYVFRKRSFLRQNNPRVCSPALLASMLWIGCLTSESPYLASSPSARSQLSEKLINLTISLLKPLVHTQDASPTFSNSTVNGVTLGNFGMPAVQDTDGLPGAPGGVDDVATYMHLAIVISASEYKAASLRWWNAAWSLARELKLGKEVPMTPPPEQEDDVPGEVDMEHSNSQNGPIDLSEEQREERRRIWWLLFAVDRHLALCYNRPLSLLDIECDGLLQPVDDSVWQAGEFYNGDCAQTFSDSTSPFHRQRGAPFECTGLSIYAFFLPLMTILGEIVELNHARKHPRFGQFRNGSDWDDHAAEITRQLDAYGDTLQQLRARAVNEASMEAHETLHPDTPRSVNSTTSRAQEALMRARIVVAYGTHLMHTLHILLNGKWDPIALLDDNDLWISSQSFIDATGHAVSAAEALNEILEHDPDLSFMPFFFGIYLLQGSFLLLLIADKLQGEANPNVVKACETIVRAHEACIVTLNTEYQRNFRKVMRSALQQVRGRGMDEHAEFAQQRRREMLSLYRWSGDGQGLAL